MRTDPRGQSTKEPRGTTVEEAHRAGRWVLGLAALCLVPVRGAADSFCEMRDTELDKLRRGEVLVELREVEGSVAKEGCARGVVDADPQVVFQIINDADKFEEFMPRVAESEVTIESEGSYLNTQRLNLPFPLKDRSYTIRVRTAVEEKEGAKLWRVSWTYVEDSGNVKENYGSWTLRETAPGETLVIYRLFSDPGGMIPKWAVNRATTSTLPGVIQAVRERVEETTRATARN